MCVLNDQWVSEKDLAAPDLLSKFYRAHLNTPRAINGLLFRSRLIRPWEKLQASGRHLIEGGGGVRVR